MMDVVAQVKETKKPFPVQTVIITVMAMLLLIISGITLYLFLNLPANPEREIERNLATTIKQVGKHVLLPEGETPTLLTVSDPALLSDQEFFAHAKEGDKVLVYAIAGKVILYNPTKDRIVEISQFQVPQDQSVETGVSNTIQTESEEQNTP